MALQPASMLSLIFVIDLLFQCTTGKSVTDNILVVQFKVKLGYSHLPMKLTYLVINESPIGVVGLEPTTDTAYKAAALTG